MNLTNVNLVYLQHDLRIYDHPGFFEATQLGLPVIAVYLIPKIEQANTVWGWRKTGKYRNQFLNDSLLDLRKQLLAYNIPLLIFQQPIETVATLLKQHVIIQHVYASVEPGSEEQSLLHDFLKALGNPMLHLVHDRPLLHPDHYPWLLKALPQRFTDARMKIEATIQIKPLVHLPIPVPPSPAIADDRIDLETPVVTNPWMRGGETFARHHLQQYFFEKKHILTYKQTRNNMLAFEDSSKLSPALALGLLSPREIYWQLKKVEQQFGQNQSTYWLWFELLWRDYFYYLHLQHQNRFFFQTGIHHRSMMWKQEPTFIDAVLQAKTGYPLVDANLKELYTTGWMSNRGRQNVASFLSKTLHLDWRWGASLFEHYLIDYDVSSNYGNWQYVSGVGVDPREDRLFNVSLQAKKYDPKGDYLRHWLPALRQIPTPTIFEPWKLNGLEMSMYQCEIGKDYPSPIIDDRRVQLHD
jgi:deoxyribodipyrimidine photo-lyase